MKRLLAALALLLMAATPEEALPGLEADGFYIESGSSASEQVVSDAVFEGRSDGGRLYIVVLAEEPSGGATTFSDSTLDLLGGDGYVVTVAPETVGFSGDGSSWSADEMNSAIDASLSGDSDDSVVQIFIENLTGQSVGSGGGDPGSGSGGLPWGWILLMGGAAIVVWMLMSNRRQEGRAAGRLQEVKEIAKAKLDEVANDILDMEGEVALSENEEVESHYRRASEMYTQAIEDTERATTLTAMLEVTEELDLAIWELDSAEALLDGKPKPPKPKPVTAEPVVPPPLPGQGVPIPGQGTISPPSDYDRRPQRHSSGSNDLLTILMTMMAMGGMRGGGFGGPMGGWTSGGGGRIGGGGGRFGGGGRIRGGGRRG